MIKPKNASPRVKVLDKTLDLLEVIGASEQGKSLTELVSLLDLPAPTVFRLLQHLVSRGYIEQDSDTKFYFLGLRVLVLRGQAIRSVQLAARVRPLLQELMLNTGCLAHLAVYRDGEVVYIDRVDTPNTAAVFVPVGKRVGAYYTALGKVMLAALPRADLEEYLQCVTMTPFTANTLADAPSLRAQLETVRQRGYATDMEEANLGVCCVASSLRDYTGRVVAAISISVRGDLSPTRIQGMAPVVMQAASRMSQSLGYQAQAAQAILDLQVS